VVDDDARLLEFYQEALTSAGYHVTACNNGHSALQALRAGTFDAVLSDIQMPDTDGIELLRGVREHDADLPVVLITGTPTLQTAIDAIERGALLYLVKPVALDKLLATAQRAVTLGALGRLKRQALGAIGLDAQVTDHAALEAAFARALGSLWMAYQPIVQAKGGALYSREALLRSTEATFPHPGVFLDAAERLGRIPELGRNVRASVAAALASGALPGTDPVFVNLHALELSDEALLDPTAPLSRFAPRAVLEITERASLDGIPNGIERVAALRGLGYRIALDDLGAGYAGLNSFLALTPEIVKLDMALVRGLDRDPVKRQIVGSMASLCRDLGMVVVAEGIETEAEREAATQAGCDLLQGYLFGRPARLP
jgi:EAL domain-containing protein (putative c-di-GMP-specific phosphodiesterase class I)